MGPRAGPRVRTLLLVVALAVALPACSVAATVEVVGYCVDGVPGRECEDHLVCLGPRDDGRAEACALGIPEDVLPDLLP